MDLEFHKMNGAGNDFVLIDARNGSVRIDREGVSRICDRRRGVGADGLICIETIDSHDFFMRFFNADGSEAGMCGNGARCAAAFAVQLGVGREESGGRSVHFLTGTGEVEAVVTAGNNVRIHLMDAASMRLNVDVRVAPGSGGVHFMTVGTRHAIVPVPDAGSLTDAEVRTVGRGLRNDPAFAPEGANVNFFSEDEQGLIHLRTYEKGVEDETHGCGTGSVACAVYLSHARDGGGRRRVAQHGGEIFSVSFIPTPDGATDVWLEGPVALNFVGTVTV